MKKFIFVFLFLIANYSSIIAQSGWYWANPLPQGNTLKKVKFIDNNTGFLIGYHGALLRTTNGGLNWQTSQLTSLRVYSIFFLNSQTGFISASNATLFKTTDAGNSWSSITCTSLTGYNFEDIHFMNENTG
ncbi:MAG TPA: YCF48-related protein, partial [Ignavibacteria bacterium]